VSTDLELMGQALALAGRARLRTPPNPWVGCVIVRDGEIVGEGATQAPGGPHAEVEALRAAGDRARGATAYVTLEPCVHQGRTPPCTDALIAAGVARVVVALEDPDPNVSGRGIAQLREHGITVDVGIGAENARLSLAPYLLHRRLGRSFCLLKTAMSVDGRIAAADGTSQWITGPEARADAHIVRSKSQAVVIGAGTALADRPTLTARDVDPPVERQPLRVLLDARGRVPAVGPLFDVDLAPTLVLTTADAPGDATNAWLAAGAKVLTIPAAANGHGVDLAATLETLAGLGVLQAMFEGGAQVAGALIEAQLVDRLLVYVAPTVLGTAALPAFATAGSVPERKAGPRTMSDARGWQLVDVARLGADVRLTYEPGAGSVPEREAGSVPEREAG
jgi:diaminohydroxyphosphoribosylaminopyrimidine deaminase / 5-amino-6-(5-phosphoribosylamino)uracil reductase